MAAQIHRLIVSLTDTFRATRESVVVRRAIRPSELDVQREWHAESSVAPTAVARQYLDWASSCWRQTHARGPWLGCAHATVAEEWRVRATAACWGHCDFVFICLSCGQVIPEFVNRHYVHSSRTRGVILCI